MRKRLAEHRGFEIGVDDRGRSDGRSSRRAEPFDWSQPAFESQETRNQAFDALPLTRRQRRNVWWQMVAFAVVCSAATAVLVVMATLRSASALFGLAVLTALPRVAVHLRGLAYPAPPPRRTVDQVGALRRGTDAVRDLDLADLESEYSRRLSRLPAWVLGVGLVIALVSFGSAAVRGAPTGALVYHGVIAIGIALGIFTTRHRQGE